LTDSARSSRAPLWLGLAFVLLWVSFPLFVETTVAHLGVRVFAVGMVTLSALSLRQVSPALPPELRLRPIDTAVPFVLVALALVSGARVFLLLLPAWVYAVLARIFFASLRGGGSAIETAAKWMQPYAPDFVRPYCRRVTVFWGVLFGANALAVAGLALFAPAGWWRAWTGWIVWTGFVAITAVEFVVRKIHFRIYDGGPIDSVFERFFPAESTEMGRRATAYKVQMRRSLGRPERGR